MLFHTGVKNLLEDEAVVVGGSNHSHATQDLYDAIAAGDYPEWKLYIQVAMDSACLYPEALHALDMVSYEIQA